MEMGGRPPSPPESKKTLPQQPLLLLLFPRLLMLVAREAKQKSSRMPLLLLRRGRWWWRAGRGAKEEEAEEGVEEVAPAPASSTMASSSKFAFLSPRPPLLAPLLILSSSPLAPEGDIEAALASSREPSECSSSARKWKQRRHLLSEEIRNLVRRVRVRGRSQLIFFSLLSHFISQVLSRPDSGACACSQFQSRRVASCERARALLLRRT